MMIRDITTDIDGNVYLTDVYRVQKYDPNGNLITTIQSDDLRPRAVAIDLFNRMNIVHANNLTNYVWKFAPEYYYVRGQVIDKNGPVKGAVVSLSGSKTATIITEDNGDYEFKDLAIGNYYIAVSKSYYLYSVKTYSPLNSNQENQNFIAEVVVNGNEFKILGGEQGYVNTAKGEKAQFVFNHEDSGIIEIKLYDLFGTLVWETNKEVSANNIEIITWDGKNNDGEQVSSGIYIAHINGAGIKQIKKVAIIK